VLLPKQQKTLCPSFIGYISVQDCGRAAGTFVPCVLLIFTLFADEKGRYNILNSMLPRIPEFKLLSPRGLPFLLLGRAFAALQTFPNNWTLPHFRKLAIFIRLSPDRWGRGAFKEVYFQTFPFWIIPKGTSVYHWQKIICSYRRPKCQDDELLLWNLRRCFVTHPSCRLGK
jgi:hypothetical protein